MRDRMKKVEWPLDFLADWRAQNRRQSRRAKAIDVLEEAAAEMARLYQKMAQGVFEDAWANNADEASDNYRLARRYLLALVGDGRGEE